MLIVTSLLFGISFLTQVVVLAAPLSLNGVSINARGFHNGPAGQATQADHSESAGRADPRPPRSPGMFALIISRHFHPTLKLTESLFSDDEKPGFVDKKHLAAKIVPYNYGSCMFIG